jgi:hypothetical protein
MSQQNTEKPGVPRTVLTSHAMLIPWGLFAQRIGLVRELEEIPIGQRSRDYTPQTKLIEFMVSIFAGCAYLQDISKGCHPLDQDQATAEAWGQGGWADYSGVSRTLKACNDETVAAVRNALQRVSYPFIEQETVLALNDRGVLIFDGDLTGRPVSSTSTTYPEAAFGWMGDQVQLGYQAAMVSMHSPTYGRLWLSVAQHPGDTVSCTQAEAMARAAEARTGARPWRRTDLLAQRIEQLEACVRETEAKCKRGQERLNDAQERLAQVEQERQMWAQRVMELEKMYQTQNRPERPHSRLAQARRKLDVRKRRIERRQKDVERAKKWSIGRQQKVMELQEELAQLEQRLVQFTEDNETNPWPIRAIFRLDGGFGSGPNVALLIEMGYEVYSKGIDKVIKTMRKKVTPTTDWASVGKNAEMVAWDNVCIKNCPYPVNVALERFALGDKKKYGVLIHYGQDPVIGNLDEWFAFYNGRQTIEAGIKEGKNVFQMHHLKVRSRSGLEIQEEFGAFAANFVRWAAAWLHETNSDMPAPFDQAQPSVKQMVRIAANTSAWVIWQPRGCLLRFTELSAFAGTELVVCDAAPIQLVLPLFKSCVFSPI